MSVTRLWLTAAALQALLLTASCGKPHKPHRRSMATQQTLPLSKGGWRPVVGNNGFIFGFGTAPLHAQSYKIPIPVLDNYASPVHQYPAKDGNKLTTIAQSYRPTTLRTVPSPTPAASQPINSYLNPFAIQSSGLNHYKYVQNFPVESVLIRNPHNPYAARPVFSKYPTNFKQQYKQQYPNHMQQLTNIQPIQFGQYVTNKPLEFRKPIENYVKPTEQRKPSQSNIETFKPEVFKLPDSETAPQQFHQQISQQLNQQVKTAQQQKTQQNMVTTKMPVSPYPQYTYQDGFFPPSILGTFGSFGLQSVKSRDPIFPTKTTYIPSQPTKQTLFNSFSFAPNFKTTPQFVATTPKLQTTANQIHYGSTWGNFNVPTQATKVVTPAKIDPNTSKGTFKPSPQDPFIKYQQPAWNNVNYKVSTYNPNVQTSTFSYSNFHDIKYTPQNAAQSYFNQQNLQNQQNTNLNYDKKSKIHDSVGVNQQVSQQFASPPKKQEFEATQLPSPYKPTYEVTENSESDVITHSSPAWSAPQENYKSTEESVTKQQHHDVYRKPVTTFSPELHEEYAIVTEGEKGYENSLSYDGQVESQSRRPVGDDFEPIGNNKLKDYYYKVSTPTYNDHSGRRTKKPTESKFSIHEVTTPFNKNEDDLSVEPLPTLPPSKHFKRPSSTEATVDKDKVRKRNKIRRRRPQFNRDSNTRKPDATSTTEETYTIKPRVRPSQRPQNGVTAPTTNTDLTTSALPTISPTNPTIVKKKLINRRPYTTTTEKPQTTTATKDHDSNKDSSIMKISASSRPHFPKLSVPTFDYRTSEIQDYSHKQDEKDTPTSDIAVSLSDSLRTTSRTELSNNFSFHRDAKPIEVKLEPVNNKETTTEPLNSSEDSNEVSTTTPQVQSASNSSKILRPRLKNKYDRPRFSVKDYRNRLSSTTSTTEKPESQSPKLRFPQRRVPEKNYDSENGTEGKKFTPKDPRQRNGSETEQPEKEIHSTRPYRQRQTTVEPTEGMTQKISSRIRNGSRRPKPTDETPETTMTHIKRPLRKKIMDSTLGESVQDVAVTETVDNKDITSERTRSESAIMKIADKKHHDQIEHLFEHSKRVSDLTLAASKDYNTPGMFKTVAANSRRIPSYFTIATDDPILPIEAFFPQLNQKKES